MQKFLLAAAAVVTLAAPAVSMAQPYYEYQGGYREAPRYESPRYEDGRRHERREEARRAWRYEREREWRAAHWRAEHRGYYGYRPY